MTQTDIELFFTLSSRDNNDNDNNIRETIFTKLSNNEIDYTTYDNFDKWEFIDLSIKELLSHIADINVVLYDTYKVTTKGGRGNSYDFEIKFFLDNEVVYIQKLEYKNAASMNVYPQCLQWYVKNDPVKAIKYHEFFYDNYLNKQLLLVNEKFGTSLSIDNVDKSLYLKECFKTESKLEVFQLIEKLEYQNMTVSCEIPKTRIKDKKYEKMKSDIVNDSITEYITLITKDDTFSGESFLAKISEQEGKLFIFWDYKKQIFSIDSINVNTDTEIIDISHNIPKLKGQKKTGNVFGNSINTVIIRLNNNSQFECLLRWKNHKGVLGPAWQIKYVTHGSNVKRFK